MSHPINIMHNAGRRLLAVTSFKPSHFGPAVKRKPAKNNGMNPMLIKRPWAAEAGTAQTDVTPSDHISKWVPHQRELAASINAAMKKARR